MTKIEWAEAVWNPVRGCSRISPGCQNCYAERTAVRFKASGYKGLVKSTIKGPRWTGVVRLVPEKLREPLSKRLPTRYFVNSMSDLFHEGLQLLEIARVLAVIAVAGRHDFLVLTKRAERMRRLFSDPLLPILIAEIIEESNRPDFSLWEGGGKRTAQLLRAGRLWPLPNLWAGVSIESDDYLNRAAHLQRTPAAIRWLSLEPLIGPLQLWPQLIPSMIQGEDVEPLDWVVVGGESGGSKISPCRPCNVAWVRSIVQECSAAGVPCFVKQLGSIVLYGGTADSLTRPMGKRYKHPKGGDPAEWPEDLRVRQFPTTRSTL